MFSTQPEVLSTPMSHLGGGVPQSVIKSKSSIGFSGALTETEEPEQRQQVGPELCHIHRRGCPRGGCSPTESQRPGDLRKEGVHG